MTLFLPGEKRIFQHLRVGFAILVRKTRKSETHHSYRSRRVIAAKTVQPTQSQAKVAGGQHFRAPSKAKPSPAYERSHLTAMHPGGMITDSSYNVVTDTCHDHSLPAHLKTADDTDGNTDGHDDGDGDRGSVECDDHAEDNARRMR